MAEPTGHFLRLEIVAPDGPVFEGDVAMVVVPAMRGELGILPRHAPLVAQLSVGEIRVQALSGSWMVLAVAEGFVKVQFDTVNILAAAAELASEIDVPRAEAALERATQRLETLKQDGVSDEEEVDVYRESMALKRARNRLRVVQRD
ncbi:MAG: ATP synthase F1 subunit epsilon [Thermoleophilia bacterium]|nr:ATP synthase F1 subunit epsilon [Thermoleophilia bacterium]